MLIAEIRLEKLSLSEDPVELNSIPKEGFDIEMCFESNTCISVNEGNEVLSLNALKVDSSLKSFRWMSFDSNESSDVEVEHEWRDELEVPELEWSFLFSIKETDGIVNMKLT